MLHAHTTPLTPALRATLRGVKCPTERSVSAIRERSEMRYTIATKYVSSTE